MGDYGNTGTCWAIGLPPSFEQHSWKVRTDLPAVYSCQPPIDQLGIAPQQLVALLFCTFSPSVSVMHSCKAKTQQT